MNLPVFYIKTKGKMKPNLVMAEDEAKARAIMDEHYPKFAKAEKTITVINRPVILD